MARPRGLPKTGGRKVGTPNRINSEQTDRVKHLCELHKVDPLEALLILSTDPSIEINQRISILKELAQYLYPKRKSVEIEADIALSNSPQIQIYLPDNGRS